MRLVASGGNLSDELRRKSIEVRRPTKAPQKTKGGRGAGNGAHGAVTAAAPPAAAAAAAARPLSADVDDEELFRAAFATEAPPWLAPMQESEGSSQKEPPRSSNASREIRAILDDERVLREQLRDARKRAPAP